MNRSVKTFGGVLLILLGASILLGMFGIHLGGIVSLAIGAWLIYWGYSKWQEKGEASFTSVALLIIGSIIVVGGLGGIVSFLIGAALVYGGYRLLKRNDDDELLDDDRFIEAPLKTTYDLIDEEFEKLMNEGGMKYDS